jgi:hypothetical protein
MKRSVLALLLLAFSADCLVQFPSRVFAGPAEDVQAAMRLLKSKAATLGAAIVHGEEAVAGEIVPALHFGATKMNNNFALVDEVQKEVGGTATIFVKSGDQFVRVATNIINDDGSRFIGPLSTRRVKPWRLLRRVKAISERPTSLAVLTSLAMNQSAMPAATSSGFITSAI